MCMRGRVQKVNNSCNCYQTMLLVIVPLIKEGLKYCIIYLHT